MFQEIVKGHNEQIFIKQPLLTWKIIWMTLYYKHSIRICSYTLQVHLHCYSQFNSQIKLQLNPEEAMCMWIIHVRGGSMAWCLCIGLWSQELDLNLVLSLSSLWPWTSYLISFRPMSFICELYFLSRGYCEGYQRSCIYSFWYIVWHIVSA